MALYLIFLWSVYLTCVTMCFVTCEWVHWPVYCVLTYVCILWCLGFVNCVSSVTYLRICLIPWTPYLSCHSSFVTRSMFSAGDLWMCSVFCVCVLTPTWALCAVWLVVCVLSLLQSTLKLELALTIIPIWQVSSLLWVLPILYVMLCSCSFSAFLCYSGIACWAPDTWSKGCEFKSRQERRKNFLLQG